MNSLLCKALAAILLLSVWSPVRAEEHLITSWFLGMTPVDLVAEVGDVVRWTLVVPPHDVIYNPSLDDQDLDVAADGALVCADNTDGIRIDAGGVAEFALDDPGIYYLYCATIFPGHCLGGSMRVKVTVADDPTSTPEGTVSQPWSITKSRHR